MADPVNVAQDGDVVDLLLEQLRGWLPTDWQVAVEDVPVAVDDGVDAVVSVQGGGLGTRILLQVKERVTPRGIERSAARQSSQRQLTAGVPVVVAARWISPRARAALSDRGLGYVDLTGNASLTVARPPIVIRTAGADRDPRPAHRSPPALRGPLAGRLVRTLADVRPPYGVGELAKAAGVSVPYASRLLDVLDQEALVSRGARGRVEDVDWAELLRRRAETYSVLDVNRARTYVAAEGARRVAEALRDAPPGLLAVTGSFVASRIAPVAAPSTLLAYTDDPDTLADRLGLLPADAGSDVALLRPYDPSVLSGVTPRDGLPAVAPSQVVLDCLGGPGRMPAEGEAVLGWMAEHEQEWRRPGLTEGS